MIDMNTEYAVSVDNEVIEYMKKMDKKELKLDIVLTGGGCCPFFDVSEIQFAKPDQPDLYDVYEEADIKLNISKKTKVIEPLLHFKLKEVFGGEMIYVEGIDVKQQYFED
ncbi:MAG: hypothetical protein PWP56_308 [Acetobacterium sp.]|uniref:hypothetical protein n=1 Tax=Acetobacterium sp. K1/6 TaxID=3055467 RepID=UPI0029E15192|nr:hypothetical protein [Acetobacterium sp. K1/6]MDK2940795.1 hypothetical protein [Acetobacterium sp.]MDZ5726537.1 hypothetical protein [Acetobacterium sp. K1/6]